MESYKIEKLSFSYPGEKKLSLNNINLEIKTGEFILLCGPSGSGKTTLLKHLKSVLSPHGIKKGKIYFEGQSLEDLDLRKQTSKIGFVMQSPENQIVTDKVWHELAFGLESLGYDNPTIRLRVAEMASFFGIENWFYKDVNDLSGGQKQLLNLAGVMTMQPSVLILDEPTSQLDPIAASDFLASLVKINREIGTTIILTEHRLEEAMSLADRVIVMDRGKVIGYDSPKQVGQILKEKNHKMFLAMPAPMRIYAGVENNLDWPINVREGRFWLDALVENGLKIKEIGLEEKQLEKELVLEVKDAWFKYGENLPDIVKGLSLKLRRGEFLGIMGGNGTGKSTSLSLIVGNNTPYRGQVYLMGKNIEDLSNKERFNNLLGLLPQNPQSLFVKKTVEEDLYEILKGKKYSQKIKDEKVKKVISICDLKDLLKRHPYDLSGGESQKAALAKVLLLEPQILLLDEPTKGLDAEFKNHFAHIIHNLRKKGMSVVMVSHDIEFCAEHTSRCALFFDGNIVSQGSTRKFFSGNSFYTSSANRMARHRIENGITVNDIIGACGGKKEEKEFIELDEDLFKMDFKEEKIEKIDKEIQVDPKDRNLSKRTIVSAMLILLLIPLTIFVGMYYLGDRKYYFISILIILEIMIPFFMVFEKREPQPRELVVIAVLCAIGVAGRAAFFMIPQFKPVAAIVIISGVAFGPESGFLVGAITMFLSNILYGQGPLTPWQMFAMGIIGFLAGIFFRKGFLRRDKCSLSIFGGLSVFFIYGLIMNSASVLVFQAKLNWKMIRSALILGIPFDLIHGGATFFFLMLMGESFLEKLDRIKIKYGLVENN